VLALKVEAEVAGVDRTPRGIDAHFSGLVADLDQIAVLVRESGAHRERAEIAVGGKPVAELVTELKKSLPSRPQQDLGRAEHARPPPPPATPAGPPLFAPPAPLRPAGRCR